MRRFKINQRYIDFCFFNPVYAAWRLMIGYEIEAARRAANDSATEYLLNQYAREES